MRKIIFNSTAEIEFMEACAWYQEQSYGLEKKFDLHVKSILEKIRSNPFMYQKLRYSSERRAPLQPYPYVIIYRIINEDIIISAIFNTYRESTKWQINETLATYNL